MVSVVIPTYKRIDSLIRLINSINKQSYIPQEIIVIAAGYKSNQLNNIKKLNTNIQVIPTIPSVCKQRNIGIIKATCDYVLLCDDDIELPNNYIESLKSYFDIHQELNIITGRELQLDNNNWSEVYTKITNFGLIYSYIFGISICSNLDHLKRTKNPIIKHIYKRYKLKNNNLSKGGWPTLTNFDTPIMKTSIYGLGCSMIKRKILEKNLYNESLGQNGIGDNYEVALKINGLSKKIHVLRNLDYKHYKEVSNRHQQHINYYKRCSNLDKFLRELPCFGTKTRIYFIWSLIGNGLRFLIKGDFNHLKSNQKVLFNSLSNLFKL